MQVQSHSHDWQKAGKTLFAILIGIAIAAYLINSHLEQRAKRKAARLEAQNIEQQVKAEVSAMVLQTGANKDWKRHLSNGEAVRVNPVLTIELERVWLQAKPILFTGIIKDITTYDELRYLVTVERGVVTSPPYIVGTDLQLELRAEKRLIDAFLREHPNTQKYFNNGIAVVAQVEKIRTDYVLREDGREEVKIGHGELVEILFTGNTLF